MKVVNQTINLGNGKEITIETGKLAKQADGAVVVRVGDTMLLATVVSNKEAKEDMDFLPLTVDYREKFASTGRFPGGFLKREARPSDEEILTMRLVDRALRPLFPDDYHAETQVMIQLMSSDKENMPDQYNCLAAAAALAVSDVPFNGPVSEVRVARKNSEYLINPTFAELEGSEIDLMVAGTLDSVVMVEGEMTEVSEQDMLEAIKEAHKAIVIQCKALNELTKKVGKEVKREYEHEKKDEELEKKIFEFSYQKCYDIAKQGINDKHKRSELFGAVKEALLETIDDDFVKENKFLINQYFKKAQKEAVRRCMLDEKIRLDGRKMDEIRHIWSEAGYLPSTHGSALFQRGETQALMSLTLGSKLDVQRKDSPLIQTEEDFILHYNFPPFSTGEARPIRGVSRREIGHGNLALRALKPMLPSKKDNPYTIRLVSEILESNGSSSMATVCAGTIALMDGGIKMKKPVSGIAMGLITDNDNYVVLSDILGDEDHLGDMDFKVTGTADGITACQMDIKIEGLDFNMLEEALNQAKAGRLHILDKIKETISEPREDYKPHVPRIETIEVPDESIGGIIGKGGETIQAIQAETNTSISIGEPDDNKMAIVEVYSDDKEGLDEAMARIKAIAFPPVAEIGETYSGKVKNIVAFGAFVEILPGIDALLHVSEIAWERVEKVEDYLKTGEVIDVKVIGKDPRNGKLKISRKALLPKPERKEKTNA